MDGVQRWIFVDWGEYALVKGYFYFLFVVKSYTLSEKHAQAATNIKKTSNSLDNKCSS